MKELDIAELNTNTHQFDTIQDEICEPPTVNPTKSPSPYPTKEPTPTPTNNPTNAPTSGPTKYPTRPPTQEPSTDPTQEPTPTPTKQPLRREQLSLIFSMLGTPFKNELDWITSIDAKEWVYQLQYQPGHDLRKIFKNGKPEAIIVKRIYLKMVKRIKNNIFIHIIHYYQYQVVQLHNRIK